jgi:hypothetical protein
MTTSNKNNLDLTQKSSIKQNYNLIKEKQDEESGEKRTTHQEMFTQFNPTMTYSRGEIDLSSMSPLQRDTKR